MSAATGTPTPGTLKRRQQALGVRYRDDPGAAVTVKRVRTRPETPDSVHGVVEAVGPFPDDPWDFGTDAKVGGLDDLPNSGHLLCAALAACEDNTVRMLAERLGVRIDHLTVEVVGDVDCRGCLALDPDVAVGFGSMDLRVDLRVAPDTDPHLLTQLQEMSERLCVNLDTLRRGVPVSLSYV